MMGRERLHGGLGPEYGPLAAAERSSAMNSRDCSRSSRSPIRSARSVLAASCSWTHSPSTSCSFESARSSGVGAVVGMR